MAVFGRLDIYYPDGHLEQSALAGELISVGRAPQNTLVLDNDAIAPYQFQLRYEQGRVLLINLETLAGTRVAGTVLPDSQPLELHEVTDIEIGDLRLVYYPGSDQPTLPMGAVADRTQPLRLDFHLHLERPLVEVFPASSASVQLTITNRRPVETRFQITFSGLPEGWGKLNQAVARIAEGESDLVSLHIVPPRRAATPPADYPVTITVNPINEPIRTVQQLLTVRLREFVGLSVAVDPPLINNGESFHVYLLNQGNEALPLRLRANSSHKDLAIELSERELQLSAGQRSKIAGRVRTKRPITGQVQSIPIALLVQGQNASGFLVALPARVIVKPRVSRRLFIAFVALIALFSLAAAAIISRPPAPSISSFGLSLSQVARGTPVELSWQANAAQRFVVEVDRVPVAELAQDARSYTLSTDSYIDPIEVALIAVQGESTVIVTRPLTVYQPVTIISFTTDRPAMQRNVRGRLVLNWQVEGAAKLNITIPEGFDTLYEERSNDGSGETALSAVPETNFELVLIAEDEQGAAVQRHISIPTEDPECTPISDAVLYAGPDRRFQQTNVAISAVPVLVRGINESKDWLQVELANGESAWGSLDGFSCAVFDPTALKEISDTPVLPTATATSIPTETPTLTITALPPARQTELPTASES